MTHDLKILPKYFNDILFHGKCFEIRKNDRDYHVGDKLVLHEIKDGKWTGNSVTRWIIYIHHGSGEYGIERGYCVLGLTDNPNDKYTPT